MIVNIIFILALLKLSVSVDNNLLNDQLKNSDLDFIIMFKYQ